MRWLTCRLTLLRAAESPKRDIPDKSRVVPPGKAVDSVAVVHLPSTFRLASAWLIAAINRICEKLKWRTVLCVIANIADLLLTPETLHIACQS